MKHLRLWLVWVGVVGSLALPTSLVYADCGIDHANSDGSTLMEAATALEATQPELAAKVKALALKTYPVAAVEAAAPEHKEHGGGSHAKEHGGS